MILGIADHGIAGAGELLFGRTGHGRIESGENEIAIERGIEVFDDEVSGSCWNGRVEMPLHSLRIFFPGGTLGSSNFGQLKPRMIGEQLDETLPDRAGGPENASAKFLLKF